MEKINFKAMQKKDTRIAVRLSAYEKEHLQDLCAQHNVTISDLIRYAISNITKMKKLGITQ